VSKVRASLRIAFRFLLARDKRMIFELEAIYPVLELDDLLG